MRKRSNSIRGKVEAHLGNKFEFRFNTLLEEREIRVKGSDGDWDVVNVDELRSHLDRYGFNCPQDTIMSILKSFFVHNYNPVQDYFSHFEDESFDSSKDWIKELASFVILKDKSESAFSLWHMHLKKWLIRMVRCIFDERYANKHALVLCCPKENIGKSYFCTFLCPPDLIKYINMNPVISNDKDAQKALIRNVLIVLDEMGQTIKANPHALKALLSQVFVQVRFAYQETETLAPRISSFIGNTNDMSFLKQDMGYSRWIAFEVDNTKFLGEAEERVRDNALKQAYFLWQEDCKGGDFTKEDLEDLKNSFESFKDISIEKELIQKHFETGNKEEGEFMTTTDIMHYFQHTLGLHFRLSSKIMGAALRELGFEKSCPAKRYGYFVIKQLDM